MSPSPGTRVAGRYRLERKLGRGECSTTWHAFDERLDRAVALRLFDEETDPDELSRRAGLAASLTHARVVRVFDTGRDGARFFTVSELLGASLAEARDRLSARDAVQVAAGAAEALAHAHERGVAHGNLHAANMLMGSTGVKVADFSLRNTDANADDDLRELGRLLREMVGVNAGSIPDRPPGFARVVEGLAAGAYERADDVVRDLAELEPRPVRAPSRRPRWWPVVGASVLVAAIVFGLTQLGERSPQTRFDPEGRIEGSPHVVAEVIDFDPLGDGRESPRTVGTTIDGNPQTFWSTERYSGGPDFSGLKEGVGLIFDLGSAVEVGQAQLLFPTPGCSFELRHAADPDTPVGAWQVAASVEDTPPSAPIAFETATDRYWLVWITRLTTGAPGAGDRFACAISAVSFFPPA